MKHGDSPKGHRTSRFAEEVAEQGSDVTASSKRRRRRGTTNCLPITAPHHATYSVSAGVSAYQVLSFDSIHFDFMNGRHTNTHFSMAIISYFDKKIPHFKLYFIRKSLNRKHDIMIKTRHESPKSWLSQNGTFCPIGDFTNNVHLLG